MIPSAIGLFANLRTMPRDWQMAFSRVNHVNRGGDVTASVILNARLIGLVSELRQDGRFNVGSSDAPSAKSTSRIRCARRLGSIRAAAYMK